MNNVENAMKQLIEAIKESDIYREYITQLEKVKQQPGLKSQIDDFRTRNFELQTSDEDTFGKIEQLEREFEDFRENPYVSDFLAAELDFCRMIQDINIRITESIHFE